MPKPTGQKMLQLQGKQIFPGFLKSCLGLLFFLMAGSSGSQTPYFNFQKLGSEEGLNNANIFNIEQHENGLIYFTTQNGIYFYDGYNFNKLDIDSLKSNALISVSIKNGDELYLSLREEGIAVFNLKTKQFHLDPRLKIKDNNADNIVITDDFAYLLTSEIKIIIVDLKTGKIVPDELRKKDLMNRPFSIHKTKEGRVLVGRTDGIYEATGGKQKRLTILSDNTIHSITQTKQGELVVGTLNKIYILNSDNKITKEITPAYESKSNTFQLGGEKPINNIMADDFGRIWFTSFPHENLYLYSNGRVYDIFELLDIPPSLINCMFMDEHQDIWIGTYSDGVYYIQNPFFNSINFSFNNKSLNIHQVFLSGNLLVAATSNGLYGFNLKDNQTKILSKPDETFLEPVNSITEFDGVLYYAKRNQMNMSPAMIFDTKGTYKFKPVIAKQYYPLNKEQSVVADWDNANILLCNIDATQTLETLISFPDYRISINAFSKQGNLLYIGTSNGLYVYDFKSKKYKNLVRNELNFNINDVALIGNKLYAAHEAGITDVYAGKLIEEVGPFRLNTVKKIKEFNDQIWLATLDGVFICDKNFTLLKTLNKSNGLLSNSINDITFDGQNVSIATTRGVSTSPFKNIIRYSTLLKPVTINNISSNGQLIEPDKNRYVLSAKQENITVNFYSPLFTKPNKQYFRWRMDGEEWKYFNGPTFDVILTGGSHVIEISASSDNIVWSENTTIRLEKEEKLSEKQSLYWVITFGGLIFIALVSFLWIRRVNIRAKRRLRDEQQVNLLKHQAMNSLLSPHFIFNSLTSIQNYINTNNGLRASEYLAKFSRLIRMIIEKAAQSDISLFDELARLTYYLELEKERFKNKFDYSIHIDDNVNTHEIMIPNMIIQPFVENCILHGILPKQEHGELNISFKTMPNRKFLITIEDNGIGLIKAREHAKTGHKSLGTSTINTILEINSKLSGKRQEVSMVDKSTLLPEGQGTLITIELEL
jgi:ligand-binding sensor domain-containing protein/two-component sensor histidine kinase